MAESVTIARPYAQAVFRLAREGRSLDEWSERLRRLTAIAAEPAMSRVIDDPKFSARQLAELIMSLSGEPDDRELAAFVGLLTENGRFTSTLLAEIDTIFETIKNEDEGVREAKITSAFPLDEPALAALLQRLETHFGSRLRGQVTIDPSLIGGVRVAVGDQVLDASVRGKLDAMAAALRN
ncbi:MAG: F0F1 ATP synthase subunit delta [Candidatus Accumulibacter sp.]|jgi:F-type H+-transporting ATPase subunit delta|nr:F0F1 ATP synthase subunit delta [Accumulibacter sp.]